MTSLHLYLYPVDVVFCDSIVPFPNMQYSAIVAFCLSVVGVHGAAMTDAITTLTPEACRDTCAPWTNSTIPCVENLGALGGAYDPVSGNFTFNGSKIGTYFCLCSNDAVTKSQACLECLSDRYCFAPPLTMDTYQSVCNGQESLSSIVNVKATC
jgi:hypothetical protein